MTKNSSNLLVSSLLGENSRQKHDLLWKGDEIMKINVVKVIGIAASVVGAVATLAGNWAGEKQTDAKIAEKVAEAISKANEKEA